MVVVFTSISRRVKIHSERIHINSYVHYFQSDKNLPSAVDEEQSPLPADDEPFDNDSDTAEVPPEPTVEKIVSSA